MVVSECGPVLRSLINLFVESALIKLDDDLYLCGKRDFRDFIEPGIALSSCRNSHGSSIDLALVSYGH